MLITCEISKMVCDIALCIIYIFELLILVHGWPLIGYLSMEINGSITIIIYLIQFYHYCNYSCHHLIWYIAISQNILLILLLLSFTYNTVLEALMMTNSQLQYNLKWRQQTTNLEFRISLSALNLEHGHMQFAQF